MGNQTSSEGGVELNGHKKAIYHCSCSSDGKFVLSASGDGLIKLWEVATLKNVREFKGHSSAVYCCDFSRDGKKIVSGSLDGKITVWDVETGRKISDLEEHREAVLSLSFSTSGQYILSASADKTMILWEQYEQDASDWGKTMTFAGHKQSINSAVLSASEDTILSGSSDNTLKVWSSKNPKEIRTMAGHLDAVMCVALHPDGSLGVSSSQDETVRVWSMATGKALRVLTAHSDAVRSCQFSRDGSFILSGSYDRSLIAWIKETDATDWERVTIPTGHSRGINSCCITPDGMVAVSGSWDNTIRLTPIEDVRLLAPIPKENDVGDPYSLSALIEDKSFKTKYPQLYPFIEEVEKMAGAHRAKTKMGLLCHFYIRYYSTIGFRHKHFNMMFFGQQGTGKYHLAKLYAKFLHAANLLPQVTATESMTVSTSPQLEKSGSAGVGSEKWTKTEDDNWPLVLVRASKLKGSTAEVTATNFRNFMTKHKGEVLMMKEMDSLADSAPTEIVAAAITAIQTFLSENPNSLYLLVSGRGRRELGAAFRHYRPSTPEAIKRHFSYMCDFDRYSPDELVAIFHRQCDREQYRLGSTVTDVMLNKAFALNFSFFDGSNGAGTRHLLNIARMEQGKRPDRREGHMEATDIQTAFQRLRQDWFAAHPERTFSTLLEMQTLSRRRTTSLGEEDDAEEDARAAVEGTEEDDEEQDFLADMSEFTLEDFRRFHDREMKRKEEEYQREIQRGRDENRLVVQEIKVGHTAAISRMLQAGGNLADRRYHVLYKSHAFNLWHEAFAQAKYLAKKNNAADRIVKNRMRPMLECWRDLMWRNSRRRQRKVVGLQRMVNKYVNEFFSAWRELVADIKAQRRDKAIRMHKLLGGYCEIDQAMSSVFLVEWCQTIQEEKEAHQYQRAASRKQKEHDEAVASLIQRHQAEVTDWHLSYQDQIQKQKNLRKTAEDSLHPLQQWRYNVIMLASTLVTLYGAPTFPAVTPYLVETLKQLSFGHWYVGILILGSMISAMRRLFTWINRSVLPPWIKKSFRWTWDVGLDAFCVGLALAYFSWPFACAGPKIDYTAPGFATCSSRIEWISKSVIVLAGFIVAQEGKKVGIEIHRQGFKKFVRTTAVQMVPSWFYTLNDYNVAEMVDLVKDDTLPPGKRAKACKLIAEMARHSQEMRNVVMERGGVPAICAMLSKVQDADLAQSAAVALASLCLSERIVALAVSSGGVQSLIKLLGQGELSNITLSNIVKESLTCLANVASSGQVGAAAIISENGALTKICVLLTSRDAVVRQKAAILVSSLAATTQEALAAGGWVLGAAVRSRQLLDRHDSLTPTVGPLVNEMQSEWWLRIFCRNLANKSCAARALGHLAEGSPDHVETIVKAGAVQALMRILNLRYFWFYYNADRFVRLKADAAFAVAAIAQGGDLQRGRLQEAGAIVILEQLWTGMRHNLDGQGAAAMRDEALKALQAVRGTSSPQQRKGTPPVSGTTTPTASSRNSSPRSSPSRGRTTRRRTQTGGIDPARS